MSSTLTHGGAHRARRRPRPGVVVAALVAVTAVGAGVRGWDGGPLAPQGLSGLEPAAPGTYRMAGTERDSRTGRTTATLETYTVDPSFTRDGVEHQITRVEDASGGSGEWETAFRPTGAYRLRDLRQGVSWRWEPPLRTMALPLAVGRSWEHRSTATVPDVAGTRRVTDVSARTTVARTETVVVDGRRVATFVLDAAVRTQVTDTRRVDGSVTTLVTTSEGRSWFSPAHGLVVRAVRTVAVRGEGADGPLRYEVEARSRLERLEPGRA